MKILSNVLKKTLPIILFASGSQMTILAQSPQPDKKAEKKAAIKSLVESQNYTFNALTMMPMGSGTCRSSARKNNRSHIMAPFR